VNEPQFASCNDDGEMWVMLLEKGWAKLHGSYAATEGGWATHVSMHLTGLPAMVYNHSEIEAEKLWKRIRAADSNDYAMHSASPDAENGDKDIKMGIV
jgi:hypothetical protein